MNKHLASILTITTQQLALAQITDEREIKKQSLIDQIFTGEIIGLLNEQARQIANGTSRK